MAVVGVGALSTFAESLGGVALIWLVLQAGQGAAPVGFLAAVSLGAAVVSSIFGGALVDRFGARRVAVIGSIAGAIPIGVIAWLGTEPAPALALVFILVLLAELPEGATTAAFEARLPELAARARVSLERANAADDLVDGLAGVAGAPAAGLIILYLGIGTALWIAVTVGLSAALIAAAFLPRPSAGEPRTAGAFAGFRFVLDRRGLVVLVTAAAVLVAAFQTLEDVVLPVLVAQTGLGPDALGVILGCAGGGAAIGALLYFVLAFAVRARALFLAMVVLIGAALASIALVPCWPVMLAAAVTAGIGAGALSPLIGTVLQRTAPAHLRGRVLGAAGALALSLSPVAAGLSGLLIDAVGAPGLLALFAGLVFGIAVLGGRERRFLIEAV